MALADTLQDVIDAIGDVVDGTHVIASPTVLITDLKKNWAAVASAFFSGGLNPTWPVGALELGETAFIAALTIPLVPSEEDPYAALDSLEGAFAAYAEAGMALAEPIPPPVTTLPLTKPIGNPDFSAIINEEFSNPGGTHLEGATLIHEKLLLWAGTGTLTVPPPPVGVGGVTPWV